MRKHLLYIAIILLATSCSKYLDKTPKGNLIPKTVNDFGMIMDDYSQFSSNCFSFGECNSYMMTDEFMIPDGKSYAMKTMGINGYTWADYLYGANDNDDAYNSFYHQIYICNYILENIAKAKEGGEFTKEYVEGAALLNRAYAYLILVNLYAKHYDKATAGTDLGVPLKISSSLEESLPRASVQEVYDLIITDATKSINLLQDNVEYAFRPSKAAAYALLARAYLYQGEYKKSLEASINARKLTHEPTDYNTLIRFSPNSEYGIIGWPSGFTGYKYPDVVFYKGEGDGPSTQYSYYLSDETANLFDKEKDLRWDKFITTCKYLKNVPLADSPRTPSFVFPRNRGFDVGEIYITEAECSVREGDIDNALTALNKLREKRYATATYEPITERDSEKLLKIILDERRRELLQKGARLFDLKRLNKEARFAKTITHTLDGKTYKLSPDDNHYVLAIPLNVIALNKNIIQNPR